MSIAAILDDDDDLQPTAATAAATSSASATTTKSKPRRNYKRECDALQIQVNMLQKTIVELKEELKEERGKRDKVHSEERAQLTQQQQRLIDAADRARLDHIHSQDRDKSRLMDQVEKQTMQTKNLMMGIIDSCQRFLPPALPALKSTEQIEAEAEARFFEKTGRTRAQIPALEWKKGVEFVEGEDNRDRDAKVQEFVKATVKTPEVAKSALVELKATIEQAEAKIVSGSKAIDQLAAVGAASTESTAKIEALKDEAEDAKANIAVLKTEYKIISGLLGTDTASSSSSSSSSSASATVVVS